MSEILTFSMDFSADAPATGEGHTRGRFWEADLGVFLVMVVVPTPSCQPLV